MCSAEFIATNPALWKGKTVMELGAGVAALPSMTALRCGAAKVIITEQSRLEKVTRAYYVGTLGVLVQRLLCFLFLNAVTNYCLIIPNRHLNSFGGIWNETLMLLKSTSESI
jgi:hypothetical protein